MLQKTDIVKPFDPSQIDVDISVINMGYLLDQLSYGRIDLMPDFQRSGDLWKPYQKSRLIESILLGLPLPSFYFSEYYDEEEGQSKYQVIDGQQRLTALVEFVYEQSFRLTELQFLKQYEGRTWDELGRVEQMNFKSLKITINTLRKGTPPNVKYVIFQRVNTAGIPLTPQEMRWALNQGKATQLLMIMATNLNFRAATCYSVSPKRMDDLDYANRFLAFYLCYEHYSEYTNLDDFLNASLEIVNEMDKSKIDDIAEAFSESMRTCVAIFGNDAFRKRYRVEDRRRQLSKAVFDTISVNIAKLSDQEKQELVDRKDEMKRKLMELFWNSKFGSSVSTGTSNAFAVSTRFDMVKQLINDILTHA